MNPELRKRIELAAKHGFHVTKDDGTAILEYIDTLQKQLAEAQQREARLTATNQQQRDEMGRTIEHLQAKWVEAERAREEAQHKADLYDDMYDQFLAAMKENERLKAALIEAQQALEAEIDHAAALRGEKKDDNPST